MSASQVRLEAAAGRGHHTLHLKTPAGAKNHANAEAQYRNLSSYGGTNLSLYYPVNAGDVNEFGKKVDALSEAITQQVKAAYQGEDAIGSVATRRTLARSPSPLRKNAGGCCIGWQCDEVGISGERIAPRRRPCSKPGSATAIRSSRPCRRPMYGCF